jgi:hypothetical protein
MSPGYVIGVAWQPPDGAGPVTLVGDWGAQPPGVFSACQVKAVVDNGYDLPTQEQDTPIWVCAGTTLPWSQVWSMLKHID